MGVRSIGLQSLLTVPLSGPGPKTRAEKRLEELRGVPPLEFAKRGVVERPLRGASALLIQLTPTHSGSLGGGLFGMNREIVQAQANARIAPLGLESLSELFHVGRR